MNAREVAALLDEIGTMMEVKGENPFKCRAYHNASRSIADLTQSIEELVKTGELKNVKGVGATLNEQITELVTTGKLKFYEELKKEMPTGISDLLKIPGLGPKKIALLFEELKIETIEDLKKAAEGHKLAPIKGLGEKTEENILKGIVQSQKHADKHLYPAAAEPAERIAGEIRGVKGVDKVEIAGSLRRKKEIIGDIDLVVSAPKKIALSIMKTFVSHPDVERITGEGETKSSVVLKAGINCDLRVVEKTEFPFALNYFTGSKEHNVEMRSLARKNGWSLNEYGFSELGSEEKRGKAKQLVKCATEEEIYAALGLEYIPPELRENMGEFEAARKHALPNLVTESDLRGTFHCHTTYSDGNNTLEEMAAAARALGWEYLGIADHSKVAVYAGGLTLERVKKQHAEIDKLNAKLKGFRIFKGTECDILPDGSLDWSNDVLERFDFVVASIHSKFKMTEEEGTKRIVKALKNKYVTMLGHSTGRILLQREGYPVNLPQVIKAAAEYGKIIEINAHPSRLDLDWRLWKFAKEQDVKTSINPDAHSTKGLRDVTYGINVARKGWLEKTDVLNCGSLKQILTYLKLK
jgi:DNA polymerase (family 10)